MNNKISPLLFGILLMNTACNQITNAPVNTSSHSSYSTDPEIISEIISEGIDANISAENIALTCEQALANAGVKFLAIENDQSTATLTSVIKKHDEMLNELLTQQYVFHFKEVHPNKDVRLASEKCGQKISDFAASISLSSAFYQRVAAINIATLTDSEKHMISGMLRDFKQSGVDRELAIREQIRALKKEIDVIGNEFNNNIRADVRFVETNIEDLAGLPEDYIISHPADENGVINISTDYPDAQPVMKYANNDALRKKLRIASRSRGYPENEKVLKALLKKRYELATLLGYNNFAEYTMHGKMIGTPTNAQLFLNKVGSALKAPTDKERLILLARLKQITPSAEKVEVWQSGYLSNLIKQENYALDAKEVREYFQYEKVRAGVFGLTEDLFGVQIRPWQTSHWHDDVESYEILENGKLIGRFYMDNHPRADKYKHAAHWTIRTGIKNQQIPISALACNFPKGLMEHGQVETFLHEFGHLLHNMFSGTQPWLNIAGMSMERDFVEAPSQMLEEWVWDYDTLKTFATNDKGETIPKSLVEKMNRARSFGESIATATQIFYANLSLNFYNKDPDSFELLALTKTLQQEYAPFDFIEGTSFYTNFGHLNGYSANYYTYQWSLAIATDMFSMFKQEGLRNRDVAKSYRENILSAAGSKPANVMIKAFLGREFNPDAYINSLKN